jgi:hypothetical protein
LHTNLKKVLHLYFGNELNSAVVTWFKNPTYQPATRNSNMPHWLGNVAVRKVTVVWYCRSSHSLT